MLATVTQAHADGLVDGPLPGRGYRVSGDKHFGSGSGMTSFMITTAVPSGEDAPTVFVLDFRDRPFDGSAGLHLVAEWDGVGMAATQSHAMRLDECPAIRMAWDGPVTDITAPRRRSSSACSRPSSSACSTRRSAPPRPNWRRRPRC